MVFHCGFNLHFPNDVEHLFHVHIFCLHIFFGDVSLHIFCPFLNWVFGFLLLSFEISFYILDIDPLSDL